MYGWGLYGTSHKDVQGDKFCSLNENIRVKDDANIQG